MGLFGGRQAASKNPAAEAPAFCRPRWAIGGVGVLFLIVALLAAAAVSAAQAAAAAPPTLPLGFSDKVVLSGLTHPTKVRFSPDGRVFVAEKSGILKVFDSLSSPTPTVVADLRSDVYDYRDNGLLGLALDPNFPASPYVYLLYTEDYNPIAYAFPGVTPATWNDACPTPPGPTTDGCPVQGKLVRLELSGNSVASTTPLLTGWCQQYPGDSVGDLNFGSDGMLYVSGGDGASTDFVDYGQGGGSGPDSPTPPNPCQDPPAGGGGIQKPPGAEGGALRSQSLLRTPLSRAGISVVRNGTLLRIDPATGAAAPGNPPAPGFGAPGYSSCCSEIEKSIIASGLHNPSRFALRPGTNEVWLGDADLNPSSNRWEEVDRVIDWTVSPPNFGWPCYEGNGVQGAYQAASLSICSQLYSAGTAVAPYYTYSHSSAAVAPGDGCTP